MSSADRALGIWGRLRWVGLAALVAALGLCLMPGVAAAKKKKKDTVKVMTQNLYLGSDLDRAVAAAAEGEGVPGPAGQALRLKAFDDFANQVGFILKNVQANNFNIRAQTIAKQIKKNKADLVGLQEAALFRLEVPSDGGAPGGLNPAAEPAELPFIDYLDVLLDALNKKALTKAQCKKQGLKGDKCYRGYYLAPAPVEADLEFPGDFDNDPGPNGIGGEGPAFNATTGFPPCDTQVPKETNPGGDDTGIELGDPGPPNPLNIVKDPVTGQVVPFDWNGDSSSNTANGGVPGENGNCGPDTFSGVFSAGTAGHSYASDCPDNNPINGENSAAAAGLGQLAEVSDKSDVTSSCLFHGIDGDARLTIRDAIIARKGAGVKTSNPGIGQYTSTLKIPVFGGAATIPFTRGWSSVDVNVRGKRFHFVNTHIEDEELGTIREDQASELIAPGGPAAVSNTVLVGDLNSDPSIQPGPDPVNDATESNIAFNRLTAGGYVPVSAPANTWGHAEILNNPNDNTFTKRIDWILTNNPSIRMKSSFVLNKFANGLWGSDHGGVLSVLKVPGGKKK